MRAAAAVRLPLLLGFGCLLVGSLSCALLPEVARREPGSAPRALYHQGEELLELDPDAAASRFRTLIRTYPHHPLAARAALLLARQEDRAGDPDQAVRRLRWLLREHPRSELADSARLLLAELYLERGIARSAERVASKLRLESLEPWERVRAYRLLAGLAAVRGDGAGQLAWLARIRAETAHPEDLAAVGAEIDRLVAGLDDRELAAAAERLAGRVPEVGIRLELVRRRLEAGDEEGARVHLERLRRLPLTAKEADRLRALEAGGGTPGAGALAGDGSGDRLRQLAGLRGRAPPTAAGVRGTLGVVLPLTGAFASFGEEALRGILLATGLVGGTGQSGVRLLVRDSEGDPERAAAAVRELGQREEVVAIVGPLLGDESEAAAAVADELGVPLLSLTARERVAALSPFAFRFGLTPRSEIAVLTDYAVRELGLSRFAILHPADDYGEVMQELFAEAVSALGGEVVDVVSYDPEATDFRDAIRRLAGYEDLGPGAREALARRDEMLQRAKRLPEVEAKALREEAWAMTGPNGESLPPIVDFEALFVPDVSEKLALLAPQLAFFEITGIRILAPSGAYAADLLRIAGRHVEGAVFTEVFHPEAPDPFVAEFVARYRDSFGEDPRGLAAQAFDVANLTLVQLLQAGPERQRLRDAILAMDPYPGVSGVTAMRTDGNAEKRPYLLGVRRGEVVLLD